MLTDTSRSLILLPGMLAVLLSLLEPAPRRAEAGESKHWVFCVQVTSPSARRGPTPCPACASQKA